MSIRKEFSEKYGKKSILPMQLSDPEERKGILKRITDKFYNLIKLEKSRKSKVPKYKFILDDQPQLIEPDYNYVELMAIAKYSWALRKVVDMIVRECTRNLGEIKERFQKKCKKCEYESPSDIEECPICDSKDLVKPDTDQRKFASQLIKKPNKDITFMDFARSTLTYILVVDDAYWSIVYNAQGNYDGSRYRKGKEVFIEHPAYMFPIVDASGQLGNKEYFCDSCRAKEENRGTDLVFSEDKISGKTCPKCGGVVVETAYVQRVNGEITARFGRNEVIHLSSSMILPEIRGNSKVATLIKQIKTIEFVDDYQFETQGEGKVGGLLVFPGVDHARITDITDNIEKERLRIYKRDIQNGVVKPRKSSTLILLGLDEGADKPIKIPFIDRDEIAKTFEFYILYISAIEQLFGVDIMVTTSVGKDKAQTVRSQVEVRRETAKEYQRIFADAFNDKLLPLFGVTDWIFKFAELESKDKLRDADILHQNSAAILNFANAGLDVDVDGDNIKVHGKAKIPEREPHTGKPNTESGVAPGGTDDAIHRPTEISPSTGQEGKG